MKAPVWMKEHDLDNGYVAWFHNYATVIYHAKDLANYTYKTFCTDALADRYKKEQKEAQEKAEAEEQKAREEAEAERKKQEEAEKMVVCPVCGCEHHFHDKTCPQCGLEEECLKKDQFNEQTIREKRVYWELPQERKDEYDRRYKSYVSDETMMHDMFTHRFEIDKLKAEFGMMDEADIVPPGPGEKCVIEQLKKCPPPEETPKPSPKNDGLTINSKKFTNDDAQKLLQSCGAILERQNGCNTPEASAGGEEAVYEGAMGSRAQVDA
jgi:hypothetical protein